MKEEKKKEKRLAPEDKWLIGAGICIVLLFSLFFFVRYGGNREQIFTIDEMHDLNLKGKLDKEQGYMYNGHSFVNFSGIWYSQLVSSKGSIYDIAFNFDPLSVVDIPVQGSIDNNFLDRDIFYIAFDPTEEQLKYVAQATAGVSTALVKAFGKKPVAACLKNETADCARAPIITCDAVNNSVIVLKQDEPTQITLKNNCVIVQGKGMELVRAKDRLLMRWYGMME